MIDLVENKKYISSQERAQINQQVQADLIDHLYEGCLPGTISGIPVGIAVLLDFYNYTPTYLLAIWAIFYTLGLTALTALYFIYTKYKEKLALNKWLYIYGITMCYCACLWGISVLLIPDNLTRQFFAFIAIYLIATGYAMGSIGVFELCLLTLAIILIPLITWCFIKGGFFYYLVGSYTIVFCGFISAINFRSTTWFKDSLKLKLENTLVSYQANHDVLTDLPNQRLLPQYIDSAIAVAKNDKTMFALLCFSLNRMEIINDSLGHQAGESIIQSVAERLKTLLNRMQITYPGFRYILLISRTDTFNLLLMPIHPEDYSKYIKVIFNVLDDPFYLEPNAVKLTASIGVSFYPKDGKDSKSLVVNAEAAMLTAKQFGGNRLELYREEINAQIPKKFEIENDLHNALKNNEFIVYYQPLIDFKSNEICGMEALIRWAHPVHGFISPLNFIPVAEETGLIIPIGEWVLQEACKQTFLWHQIGFSHLKVAVNLAGKQLRDENIIHIVQRTLALTGLKAESLEMEITETAILDESIVGTLKKIKKIGLNLAVDDFGTGYSGLSYLKRFAIDKLKIDQSFIKDMPANNESITIVSAILAMAKEMKLKVLAEGVETEEQFLFLKEKGCDYAQGYYFSKPLPAAEFTKFLMTHKKNESAIYSDIKA